MARGEGDRRRAVDPALHPRHGRRGRHRRRDPLRPPCAARRLVVRRRAAGRSRRSVGRRRAGDAGAAASSTCAAATTTTTKGYRPEFAGRGRVRRARSSIPQFWPEDLDYRGKRVVVIGSGATAVTLVPAMADRRRTSPCCSARRPTSSRGRARRVANSLRRVLPERLAYALMRWKNVAAPGHSSTASRGAGPSSGEAHRRDGREQLGPDCDVDTHFTPRYNPWDQRLCLVPDADLFARASATAAPRSSPTRSSASPRRPPPRVRRGRWRPTSSSSRPASSCNLLGDIALTVDGEPSSLARRWSTRG